MRPEDLDNVIIQNETEKVHDSIGRVIFYPCDQCDENFKHEDNLLTHKETHTKEETKAGIQKTKNNRLCTICNKIFQRPFHLRKHMEKQHSKKADILDFIIKCRRCDNIFQA